MKDLISIIVPVYNAEKYLEKCLTSLQTQTYEELEILLIDDGPKDNSAGICQAFCEKDSRFVYIYQENQGVSAARNRGLREAKGEYVGFVDSDDWLEQDTYETLYSLIVEESADVAIISFFLDINGNIQAARDDFKRILFDNKGAIKEMHLGNKFAGQLCNKLIKRELLVNLELPKGIAILEDMVFMWDVFFKSKKIVFQDVHKYHYVINETSATQSVKETLWTVQQACEMLLQRMEKHFPDLVPYAKKTVIDGNWLVAEALYKNKQLNKKNYMRLRTNIVPYVDKEMLRVLTKIQRISVTWCKKSYWLFRFYKWLSKNRIVRKLLGK